MGYRNDDSIIIIKIKVEDELEHKMERWEYLEELNARIKAQDK